MKAAIAPTAAATPNLDLFVIKEEKITLCVQARWWQTSRTKKSIKIYRKDTWVAGIWVPRLKERSLWFLHPRGPTCSWIEASSAALSRVWLNCLPRWLQRMMHCCRDQRLSCCLLLWTFLFLLQHSYAKKLVELRLKFNISYLLNNINE